jgi:hypothetical protein
LLIVYDAKKRAIGLFIETSKAVCLRAASALEASAEDGRSPGFKGVLISLLIETGRSLMT